jgi:hypothetical protein
MKTIKPATLAVAVAAAVNAPQPVAVDAKAQARAMARTLAFVDAYMGVADADMQAQAAEASAWSTYVEAVGHGATPDGLRDALYSALAMEADASGEDVSDARKGAGNRCKNYKRRVAVLLAVGVALLDAKGNMAEACVVSFKGETYEGSLGSVAQRLLKAGAEARTARPTKGGKAEGDEDGAEGGEIEHSVTFGADVALTASLVARVCGMIASDTPEGLAAREANEESILVAAAAIARVRLEAQVRREAAAAKVRATAAASVGEVKAAKVAVKATMKRVAKMDKRAAGNALPVVANAA